MQSRRFNPGYQFFFLLLLFLTCFQTENMYAQCGNIDHWESVVQETNTWKYQIPANNISNWQMLNFNDASWLSGVGGIGYGDGDDNTNLPNPTTSFYMRRAFNIVDTSQIESVVFCLDYDDGFVAYLNGVEIARVGLNPNPLWNDLSGVDHEALMYQGGAPEYFTIPAQTIQSALKNGNNVLSLEIHNFSTSSGDLSARPFLMLGIDNPVQNYSPIPSWFVAPVELNSNLPLMVINTLGQFIVDDPRIICDMGIINNGVGAMNCISDPFNGYNGKISIEYRGSSSQGFPKMPYGFSTVDASGNDLNVSLLGMPEEHDWILLNPYTDKSFMRDVLAHDLARSLNWYSSRAQFLELIINGEYLGVYVLLEKIKRDDERVDIAKLTNTMNSGDSVTGGYIFKIDKTTGNSGGGWYSNNYGIFLQNHVPNWNSITTAQQNYLQTAVDSFEWSLTNPNFTNPQTGYRKYANVFSFVDYFLIHELANNIDGFRLSTYVSKDRNSLCGRFTMMPLWDFNLSFGNGDYCNGYPTSGWQMYQGCGDGSSKWINQMLQDTWFKDLLSCRWFELRQGVLSTPALLNRVDTYTNYLKQAAQRDSAKWQTIGNYVWPNGWVANSWQGEIDSMKTWIQSRLSWIDANMFPVSQGCGLVNIMTLVPDEINFHSEASLDGGDWVELYNHGSLTLDLSYAMMLDGDQYEKYCVLPANTFLAPGARLVICSDTAKFKAQYPTVNNYYGPLCFKLSNAGQKLVMRDKNNKQIFSVNFSDLWQCSTDGHGRTLQLSNATASLNNQASWFAACVGGSPGTAYVPCNEQLIYSEINYASSASQDAGDWIELYNKSNQSISLSNWILRDGSDQNAFTFPAGTMLAPSQYLVAYSDAQKFGAQFPAVQNKTGPFGFGFQAAKDVVKLYDASGKIRYSVCYLGSAPWPVPANAGGKTLENANYQGVQNNASNWFAGCPEGSPGFAYNPSCVPVVVEELNANDACTIYPNPANDMIWIQSQDVPDELRILDLSGKQIKGFHHVNQVQISELPQGVYLIEIHFGAHKVIRKFSK